MRIVSLLPSAIAFDFAPGLDDDLHAVTSECDFRPEARSRAVVSGTALRSRHRPLPAAEIDAAVSSGIGAR